MIICNCYVLWTCYSIDARLSHGHLNCALFAGLFLYSYQAYFLKGLLRRDESIFPVSIDIAFKVKLFSSHFNKFLNNIIICHPNCNNQDNMGTKQACIQHYRYQIVYDTEMMVEYLFLVCKNYIFQMPISCIIFCLFLLSYVSLSGVQHQTHFFLSLLI